jgi:hypothetical protein
MDWVSAASAPVVLMDHTATTRRIRTRIYAARQVSGESKILLASSNVHIKTTGEGCAYDVSKNSRCAVSTWVEFLTIKDPICCMPGEIGVQPLESEYYGHCVPAGTNEPPDMLASQVSRGAFQMPIIR